MELPDETISERVVDSLMKGSVYDQEALAETAVRTLDQITAAFTQHNVEMPRLPTDSTFLGCFHYSSIPGCGTGGYLHFRYVRDGSYLIEKSESRGMTF